MNKAHDLPTDYPIESPSASMTAQVSGKSMPIRETNNSAVSRTVIPVVGRVSARQLDKIAARLSDRDREILASVEQYKFVTARHIEVMHFNDHASKVSASRTARRVLERLRQHRILATLDRRIGGVRAGSEGLVYFVDTVGDRILRSTDKQRSRRRAYEPSARFLSHTLAIADLAIDLRASARSSGTEVVALSPEPQSWRRYIALDGTPQTLKPDLYVELAVDRASHKVTAFFIEIDLGQESLPTVVDKCHKYELYRQTDTEQHKYGSFPQVIWAMEAPRQDTASRRRLALGRALTEDSGLTESLFWITPLKDAAVTLVAGDVDE